MAEQFDLSISPGASQRLIFALLGIGQLVLGTIAFQRGGFAYGLAVLGGGIAAFCAAAFFVHRLHRRLVWLGPEGVTVEEGLVWSADLGVGRGQKGECVAGRDGVPRGDR